LASVSVIAALEGEDDDGYLAPTKIFEQSDLKLLIVWNTMYLAIKVYIPSVLHPGMRGQKAVCMLSQSS
jgi:hypothetical protein